jgi:hypothetical protein
MRPAPRKPIEADLQGDYFSEIAEKEAEEKARQEKEEWEAGELDRQIEAMTARWAEMDDDFTDYGDYDYNYDDDDWYNRYDEPVSDWEILIWRLPEETTAERYRRLWAECGY